MKKNFKSIFCMVALALVTASCGKFGNGPIIWDIAPVCLTLAATDSTHDLFDPAVEGNIIDEVSVTYDGKEYKVETQDKAYLAVFHGLVHRYWGEKYGHVLVFGEFDGAADFNDMTMTVNWPDSSKDVVVYNRSFKWDQNGYPVIKDTATVNGIGGKLYLEKTIK
ncbi:MAG: hypothetical protein GX664_04690 [Bacteroidales bacterium]|jgi:hypothetical protein|nr:hypothetical protein [Bacteroidales bacterium]